MKRIITGIFLTMILAACGPSDADIASAIADTEEAIPTATIEPTPTTIPISEIDLTELLVQPGDLPAGIDEAQIRDTPDSLVSWVPKASNVIYQQFDKSGKGMGGVTVWLYETQTEAANAYSELRNGIVGLEDYDEIGDRSADILPDTGTALVLGISVEYLLGHLVFNRCHAVVYVGMAPGASGIEAIRAYAKRLDTRLEPIVCR